MDGQRDLEGNFGYISYVSVLSDGVRFELSRRVNVEDAGDVLWEVHKLIEVVNGVNSYKTRGGLYVTTVQPLFSFPTPPPSHLPIQSKSAANAPR